MQKLSPSNHPATRRTAARVVVLVWALVLPLAAVAVSDLTVRNAEAGGLTRIADSCARSLPGSSRRPSSGAVRRTGQGCEEPEPQAPLRVLVFSRTAGFRHPSIADAWAFFSSLPVTAGIAATLTEEPASFRDETLEQFDVVAFVNTTGDVLDGEGEAALERFVRSGRGFVGVHSAADTEYQWTWYGELVGAYFVSHPLLPVEVEVTAEEREHPATDHLPAKFSFTDEIYNFDRNPRFDNEILLTVDEAGFIYPNIPDTPSMGADHPIAWHKEFDGGRSFYTNLGHSPETWADPLFGEHLLEGIRWAAGPPSWSFIPVSRQARNPLSMAIAPDGRVFYIERTGEVWIWSPGTGRVTQAAKLTVSLFGENGLLGIGLDPDFAANRLVYLFYALDDYHPDPGVDPDDLPYTGPLGENVLVRFPLREDGTLDLASGEELLRTPSERIGGHEGGQITFAPDGTLLLSVGDNAIPNVYDEPDQPFGFAPLDGRPNRQRYDARRTASNPFDLRGKILRIRPDGSIPPGNLFPMDGSQGRPEIYVMGVRNPFRAAVDPVTGRLFFGDIGPDALEDGERGPRGYDEINAVDAPGNYGWPFCIGPHLPYREYDYATKVVGEPFSCAGYVPPTLAYDYSTVTELALGALNEEGNVIGRSAMAGVVSRPPRGRAPFRLPDRYDGALLMTEWTRDLIAAVYAGPDGELERTRRVVPFFDFHRPIDLEIAPDGALYVLEYGSGFGGNNDDAQLVRIEHSETGDLTPVAVASASREAGIAPLSVHLSAAGSRAPGAGRAITSYEWDLDGDGRPDQFTPEVDHTFVADGLNYASLVVSDTAGRRSFPDVVEISIGNEPPTVTIEAPAEGATVVPGGRVTVRGRADDREDGQAPCDRLNWQVFLGHNAHSHPQLFFQACEAEFVARVPADHGAAADLFLVVELTYEDQGGPNGARPLVGSATVRLNVD
jgi:glucose/arabinose dehydrogenase/type 1 glutamine amidotransferase